MLSTVTAGDVLVTPLAHQELDGWRGQASVFEDIFLVFMVLGTLVGVVVVAYMLYNAYRYREGAAPDKEFDEPTLGELPTGGSGGKKLFLSFAISAIIVIGLVAWSYTALLYVEQGAQEDIETEYDLEITGLQFGWQVEYPNGETAFTNTPDPDQGHIAIPEDTMVGLHVTGAEVWHTFGITDLRLKVDAIPGQTAESWLLIDDPDQESYTIECFELCGAGHSSMQGSLVVMDSDEWEEEYATEVEDDNDEEETDSMDQDRLDSYDSSSALPGLEVAP